MIKKSITIIIVIFFSIVYILNLNCLAKSDCGDLSILECNEEFDNFQLSMVEQERRLLEDKKTDPSIASIFSLVFGAGQIYAGDINRGLWIMGIGISLTGAVFGVLYPALDKRPEQVKTLGQTLGLLVFTTYYLWNIRDAYETSVRINEEIDEKLLISLNKIKLFYNNDTFLFSYIINFK